YQSPRPDRGQPVEAPQLERIMQAGAVPVSWVQFACELQRDWLREKTVPGFAEIVFAVEGH
ncbi:MAG: hypothetical protein EOR68_28730, partial [Mesorhizobium sp.]